MPVEWVSERSISMRDCLIWWNFPSDKHCNPRRGHGLLQTTMGRRRSSWLRMLTRAKKWPIALIQGKSLPEVEIVESVWNDAILVTNWMLVGDCLVINSVLLLLFQGPLKRICETFESISTFPYLSFDLDFCPASSAKECHNVHGVVIWYWWLEFMGPRRLNIHS